MTTPPKIVWPTESGWYLVENLGFGEDGKDCLIHRVVYIEAVTVARSQFTYQNQRDPSWLPVGVYLAHQNWEPVQSYFTIDGKPWEALRLVKLDLAALAKQS